MLKKFAVTLAMAGLLSAPALAEDTTHQQMQNRDKAEQLRNLTPEQREKFKERWKEEHGGDWGGRGEGMKEKWAAMSKEDKLKFIEEKHAKMKERQAQRDAEWSKMTPDEKIAKFEKRMQRMHERREHRGDDRGGMMGGKPGMMGGSMGGKPVEGGPGHPGGDVPGHDVGDDM